MWKFFGNSPSDEAREAIERSSRRAVEAAEQERRLRKRQEKKRKQTVLAVHVDPKNVQLQGKSDTSNLGAVQPDVQPKPGPSKKSQPAAVALPAAGTKLKAQGKKDHKPHEKAKKDETVKKPHAPMKPILKRSPSRVSRFSIAGDGHVPPPSSPEEEAAAVGRKSQAAIKGEQLLSKKKEQAIRQSIAPPKQSLKAKFASMFQRKKSGDSDASGDARKVRARSTMLGVPPPPVALDAGDYTWRTSHYQKFVTGQLSGTPAVSGFISVQEFATNVVQDPHEMESWVKSMATRFYLFWVFLVLCASFMNAVLIFVFHIMARVYARDILYEILMWNSWNVFGVIGNMISFLGIAFWGAWMLTTPSLNNKCLMAFRWYLVGIVLTYVTYSLVNQTFITTYHDIRGELEIEMIQNLKTTRNKTTRLEDYSHRYYQCCGIRNYKDWDKFGHTRRENRVDLRGGYPPTCCKTKYRACPINKPVTVNPIPENSANFKNVVQLWEYSCLDAEYNMVISVMTVLISIQSICLLGSIAAILLLRPVITHTNNYNVELVHPFV